MPNKITWQQSGWSRIFINILKQSAYLGGFNTMSADRNLLYGRMDRAGYITDIAGFSSGYSQSTNLRTWPLYTGQYRVSGKGQGSVWVNNVSFTVPTGNNVNGDINGWWFDTASLNANVEIGFRWRTSSVAPNHLRDLAVVAHPHREDYDSGKRVSPGFNGVGNWRQIFTDSHGTMRFWLHLRPEHMGPTYGHPDNDPTWYTDPTMHPQVGITVDPFTYTFWFDSGKFCGRPIEGADPNPTKFVFPEPPGGFKYEPGETAWVQFPRMRAQGWCMYDCQRGSTTTIKVRPIISGAVMHTWWGTDMPVDLAIFPIVPSQVAVGERMTISTFGGSGFMASRWRDGVTTPINAMDDPNDDIILSSHANGEFEQSYTIELDRNTSWHTEAMTPNGLLPATTESSPTFSQFPSTASNGAFRIASDTGQIYCWMNSAWRIYGGRMVWPCHLVRIGNHPFTPVRQHAVNSSAPYIQHSSGSISGGNADGNVTLLSYDASMKNWQGTVARPEPPRDAGHYAGGHNHLYPGYPVKAMIDICNECNISPGWNVMPAASFSAPQHVDRSNSTWEETGKFAYKTALVCKQYLKPGLRPVFECHTFRNWPGTLSGIWCQWPSIGRRWTGPFVKDTGLHEMGLVHIGQQCAAAYGLTKAQVKTEGVNRYCVVFILSNLGIGNFGQWAADIGFGARTSGWRAAGGDPAYEWITHWTIEVQGLINPYMSSQLRGANFMQRMVNDWVEAGRPASSAPLNAFARAMNAQYYNPSQTYQGPRSDGSVDFVHQLNWTGTGVGPPLFYATQNVPVNTPPPNTTYWQSVGTIAEGMMMTVIQLRSFIERFEAWMAENCPDPQGPRLKFMGSEGSLNATWTYNSPVEWTNDQNAFFSASHKTAGMGEVENARIAVYRDHHADGIPVQFDHEFAWWERGAIFATGPAGAMWPGLWDGWQPGNGADPELGLDNPRWLALKAWANEDFELPPPPPGEPTFPGIVFPPAPSNEQEEYGRRWVTSLNRWDRIHG